MLGIGVLVLVLLFAPPVVAVCTDAERTALNACYLTFVDSVAPGTVVEGRVPAFEQFAVVSAPFFHTWANVSKFCLVQDALRACIDKSSAGECLTTTTDFQVATNASQADSESYVIDYLQKDYACTQGRPVYKSHFACITQLNHDPQFACPACTNSDPCVQANKIVDFRWNYAHERCGADTAEFVYQLDVLQVRYQVPQCYVAGHQAGNGATPEAAVPLLTFVFAFISALLKCC